MSKDVSIVKSLAGVLNATLEIAEDAHEGGSAVALSLSKKAIAVSELAAGSAASKELESANFAATQMLKTIGLLKAVAMPQKQAVIYITLQMADKIVGAAGMANLDKCKVAVASLTTTVGLGVFTCFSTGVFTLGIGCVAGAIAIAGDAFDWHGKCYPK
ncbi:MAG: hypothetical protein RR726_17645 [Pseudomonas sp.]